MFCPGHPPVWSTVPACPFGRHPSISLLVSLMVFSWHYNIKNCSHFVVFFHYLHVVSLLWLSLEVPFCSHSLHLLLQIENLTINLKNPGSSTTVTRLHVTSKAPSDDRRGRSSVTNESTLTVWLLGVIDMTALIGLYFSINAVQAWKALQVIVRFNDELGYRGTRWSVPASHYTWPVATRVFHPGVHQQLGLVSLNRLSVGCGTTPRRPSGDFAGFWILSVGANQCSHGYCLQWWDVTKYIYYLSNCFGNVLVTKYVLGGVTFLIVTKYFIVYFLTFYS